METPALRAVCAAFWLSFWYIAALLLMAFAAPRDMGFINGITLGLPLAGLLGTASLRRIITPLKWREVLAALPFTPILVSLLLLFVKIVFHLKSYQLGMAGEMCMVLTFWASMGAFLLPLLDNDLRQKEPYLALPRPHFAVLALLFAGLAGFGLLQKPGVPDWRWHQGGYAVFVFVGLPSLCVTALGWLLGLTPAARAGAVTAAVGTLVFFAVIAYWAGTGGYFPG